MIFRSLKNYLIVGALSALFSQGAFGQMPGTFSPIGGVAGVSAVPDCTGGIWSYAGGNTIHTFTFNDTLNCPTPRTINYLAVGGGGGSGGASYSGGGGAGGFLQGTALIPAGLTTINVGPGGIGGASGQRGGNGGNSIISIPGGSSFSSILPTPALAAIGSGFSGQEVRTRWNTSLYSGTTPATGTQIRVTVGQGVAGSNTFTGLWCGHAGSASPGLTYDGSQVQIKFGGNAGATVPAGTLVSDPVNFSFDKTKDLICSFNWTGAQIIATTTGPVGSFATYAGGAYPSAGNTTFGTGTANYWYGPVVQVEVLTNQTLLANALGGTGGASYSSFINALNSGASAGGGAYGSTVRATGTPPQGNNGGYSNAAGCGNGGGGAGGPGADCTAPNGSVGGLGLSSSITGTLKWYAAGGGGGPYTGTGGLGGSGIGGQGGNYSPATACTPGAPNTGSGAGGIASIGICPGADGVVVVSYPTGIAIPPPTCTPNTAGGGTFANIIGLWHFDNNGTDQANTPHSVSSLAGGAVYSATQSKFGGYSLNIVTTATSFANIPAGINIVGTSDFTIEAWMYQAGGSTTYTGWIGDDNITTGTGANPNPFIWTSGNASAPAGAPAWATMMPGASWHHTAWVRASGTVNFYFDGVAQGTGASATGVVGNGTTAWKIGRSYSATYAMPSNSFIDEVRISNMARYTANFQPPYLPFCNN
jgi:hypothetical protein